MNILHINYSDVIGSRFNGFYMLDSSSELFNVKMAVWRKTSKRNDVFLLPPQNNFLKFIIEKFQHLSSKSGIDHIFSIFGFFLLSRTKYFKEADIIHLHIIHGDTNLSLFSLYRICRKKKVVWTIHDQWAITGGCIHPFECKGVITGCQGKCPYPRYNSFLKVDLSRFIWKIKKYVYANSKFNIIISTNWMNEKISNSPIMKGKARSIIPFGLDLNLFSPKDSQKCRIQLGIPENHFVISFRDSGLKNDTYKGLIYIKKALQMIGLKEVPITLLILEDGSGFESLKSKFNIVRTGWINSNELVNVLSASDIFLMPSLQESFGLMAIEAMACKTPVIVAEGTALPEIVGHRIGGLVVPARNSLAIKAAIEKLILNKKLLSELRLGAINRVLKNYTSVNCLQKHFELYKELYVHE